MCEGLHILSCLSINACLS
ncbi:rCG35632 [Rattus norvegicus]|uniref:RCG35632 n=1 Tax=Rattus norvegicus TaxID=10116 RepID=A6KFA4_RAT|nr:rCG35632 [Rattus norvegicus]